jgi:hypothetical protein
MKEVYFLGLEAVDLYRLVEIIVFVTATYMVITHFLSPLTKFAFASIIHGVPKVRLRPKPWFFGILLCLGSMAGLMATPSLLESSFVWFRAITLLILSIILRKFVWPPLVSEFQAAIPGHIVNTPKYWKPVLAGSFLAVIFLAATLQFQTPTIVDVTVKVEPVEIDPTAISKDEYFFLSDIIIDLVVAFSIVLFVVRPLVEKLLPSLMPSFTARKSWMMAFSFCGALLLGYLITNRVEIFRIIEKLLA